jgi:hypothetical protein
MPQASFIPSRRQIMQPKDVVLWSAACPVLLARVQE